MLELELARLALTRGHGESFKAALAAASDLLRRDFAGDAPAVTSASRLLSEMSRIEIAPPRPDISRSLNLLRAAPRGDE